VTTENKERDSVSQIYKLLNNSSVLGQKDICYIINEEKLSTIEYICKLLSHIGDMLVPVNRTHLILNLNWILNELS